MALPSLYDLTLPELTQWVQSHGEPAYRARQIFHALYQGKAASFTFLSRDVPRSGASFEEMTILPKALRQKLSQDFVLTSLAPFKSQTSSDGTVKWLSQLSDGEFLETVLIPAQARQTVCVSTQVGCAYACAFCASGMDGLRRNLTSGEIVQQVLLMGASPLEGSDPIRITNVVFMGMGEPLANYANVLKAVRILNDPEGLRIGARKITISTVGLVPMIERLAREGLQVELSISLHAPNDPLRGELMPVNRKYPLKELIAAAKAYAETTKRLITFEYILIDEVNDGLPQAKELVQLLKGMRAKVNLIPCHPTSGTSWVAPPRARMVAFERFLRGDGVPCTLRRSRGLDIDGACGQLRLRY